MQCAKADLVVIDNEQTSVYLACLMRPFRFRLVSVDLILRPPQGFKGRLLCLLKRALLTQVDKFILYFKNTAGYQRYYGISSTKIDYVAFKVNGVEESFFPSAHPEGDYVLCAGRTFRDVKTFVVAMEIAGCPGLLLQQQDEALQAHGPTQFTGNLPSNVRLTVDVGGDVAAFLKFIAGAKLVVIPRFKHDIAATGISTYLMAMDLGNTSASVADPERRICSKTKPLLSSRRMCKPLRKPSAKRGTMTIAENKLRPPASVMRTDAREPSGSPRIFGTAAALPDGCYSIKELRD